MDDDADWTYYAVTDRRDDEVWMLLRVRTYQVSRWVPHLNEWVEIPDHWDYLSGHSSTSMTVDTHKITADEVSLFANEVYDLPDDVVEARRAVR